MSAVAPVRTTARTTARTTWTDWSCTVSVTVSAPAARADVALDRAAAAVRATMAEVAAVADRFDPSSELNRLHARPGRPVPLSPLLHTLVEVALAARERSDGAVDPAVGAAVLAAGYDADIAVVRARAAADATPPAAGPPARPLLDAALRTLRLPPGQRLDLGATAKAWAVDEAARLAHEACGSPVLVGIGGDVAAAGAGEPWQVDVTEVPGGPALSRVALAHGALATSSTRARRWRGPSGSMAHHVIDPRTGRPTSGALRTASVWATDAVTANTWSTAALVWGDVALDELDRRGVSALLVDAAGTSRPTAAWAAGAGPADGGAR